MLIICSKTLALVVERLFCKCETTHCVKSVRNRNFSGPYFPAFGLNTERYSVSLRIQSKYGETLAKKISNTDTFHAVTFFSQFIEKVCYLNLHYFPSQLLQTEMLWMIGH